MSMVAQGLRLFEVLSDLQASRSWSTERRLWAFDSRPVGSIASLPSAQRLSRRRPCAPYTPGTHQLAC